MNSLIFIKFICDYFWELKLLNVLYTFLVSMLFLFLFFSMKMNYKVLKSDIAMVVLTFIFLFSFLRSDDYSLGVIDFLKLFPLIFLYGVGRLWRWNINIKYSAIFSFISLIFLAFLALIGEGYIYWGSVHTFTGGYFFKTDMAMAVMLFLIFILASNVNYKIKFLAFFISMVLVFLGNSRITIPIIFLIGFLSFYDILKIYQRIGKSIIITISFAILTIFTLSFIDFSKFGMIGFDISDPFSDSATQGRTHIWEAVLNYYYTLPIHEKIFGAGLASDMIAAKNFSDISQFETSRAHNSYLWMLVCIGWFGIISFFSFILCVFLEIKLKIKRNINVSRDTFLIFLSLLILFLVMSFSAEVIIRTQLTYFLFLYAGLCCNRKI